MQALLTRAGCFVAIIVLGFILRRTGFFKENAFEVLSKIVLKITFPASIVVNFAQMEMSASMLPLMATGFCGSVLYMIVAFVTHLKKSKSQRAFAVLNLPGYNIGIFTLPFIQSFLGPTGVLTASLVDLGNAFICLGSAYGVAASIKDGKGFSLKRIGKALMTSVPFVFYVIMISLNLLHITVPAPIISFADIIKSANAFMAMLMIGVGFQIKAERGKLGTLVKIVLLRYLVAAGVAAVFYFVLPFSLEIRQTLVILAFSPISSATPAFTRELREDVGLSSAINSLCIVISIVIMTTLLSVMMV